MLKIELNKDKGFCMIEAGGPLPEIVADLLLVIGSVGSSLDKKNHMLGATYEAMLKAALQDGMALKAPVPDGESLVEAVGAGMGTDGALKDLIENLRKKAGF